MRVVELENGSPQHEAALTIIEFLRTEIPHPVHQLNAILFVAASLLDSYGVTIEHFADGLRTYQEAFRKDGQS